MISCADHGRYDANWRQKFYMICKHYNHFACRSEAISQGMSILLYLDDKQTKGMQLIIN